MGYKLGCWAYRLYSPVTCKVTISHNVVLVELEFLALSPAQAAPPMAPAATGKLHIVAPAKDALRHPAPAPPLRYHAVRHRSPLLNALSPGPLATPTPLPQKGPAYNKPLLPTPALVATPKLPDLIDMWALDLEDPFAAGVAAFNAAVVSMLPEGDVVTGGGG